MLSSRSGLYTILAVLLAAAAAAAGLVIGRHGLFGFELGGRAFFAARISEVLALLATGLLLLVAVARRRSTGRRLAKAAIVLLVAGGIAAAARLVPAEAAKATPLDQAGPRDAAARKTLLVAVDALSWNRVLPLVRQGRLPHLARLMEEGSYGVLHSHRSWRPSVGKDGYWSPVVWTTVATGVTADKHGIDDFGIRDGDGKVAPAASWHRKVPAFWNVFTSFDRPLAVVGWWATWPAEPVRGVMVSSNLGLRGHRGRRSIEDADWLRGRKRLTYPEGFKHVVAEEIGFPRGTEEFLYREVFPLDRYPLRDGSDLETLVSVLWQDRLYLDTTLHLLRHEDFELYAVYFEGIDVVSHQFWEFLERPEAIREEARFQVPAGFDEHTRAVDRYYEIVDGYVGRLLEAAGERATVIVCSDHGFQADPTHPRGADHSPYGVLVARGEGIRARQNLNLSLLGSVYSLLHGPVSVLDVLPTLLFLHDLPVSEALDGHVLYRLFERSYLQGHQELRVPTYGDFDKTRKIEIPTEDEQEYLQRMRSLGYVG